MWTSFQINDIELRTAIFPEFDGFQLKSRWYFGVELPDGSAMSKNYLINDEKNYPEVTFGEGDLFKTNKY